MDYFDTGSFSTAEEIAWFIREAEQVDLILDEGSFTVIDGEVTIDGVEPGEWIYAVGVME